MKIINYSESETASIPDDITYGNVSGEHLLSKAKCLNIVRCNDSVLFYADRAVCKRLNNGLTEAISGVQLYPYVFYLYVDKVKFPDIETYLTDDKRLLLFNRHFNGNITEVIRDVNGEKNTIAIGVKTYSPDNLNIDSITLSLGDNSFIIVDSEKTKIIAENMFPSSISEKVEVARFGSFGRIYNSDLQINVEFPVIRKNFSEGAELESELIMSKLLYLDLNIYSLSTLNIVNEPIFSGLNRTINTKEIRNAKTFYLMNMSQQVLTENNSYKFNIKASLI